MERPDGPMLLRGIGYHLWSFDTVEDFARWAERLNKPIPDLAIWTGARE